MYHFMQRTTTDTGSECSSKPVASCHRAAALVTCVRASYTLRLSATGCISASMMVCTRKTLCNTFHGNHWERFHRPACQAAGEERTLMSASRVLKELATPALVRALGWSPRSASSSWSCWRSTASRSCSTQRCYKYIIRSKSG